MALKSTCLIPEANSWLSGRGGSSLAGSVEGSSESSLVSSGAESSGRDVLAEKPVGLPQAESAPAMSANAQDECEQAINLRFFYG
jgi:hypothetical protein